MLTLLFLTLRNDVVSNHYDQIIIIVLAVADWVMEITMLLCTQANYLGGICSVIILCCSYKLSMEGSGQVEQTPLGDFGLIPILWLIGVYLCYNWIVACASILSGIVIYILLETIQCKAFMSKSIR